MTAHDYSFWAQNPFTGEGLTTPQRRAVGDDLADPPSKTSSALPREGAINDWQV